MKVRMKAMAGISNPHADAHAFLLPSSFQLPNLHPRFLLALLLSRFNNHGPSYLTLLHVFEKPCSARKQSSFSLSCGSCNLLKLLKLKGHSTSISLDRRCCILLPLQVAKSQSSLQKEVP
ncbi:hypothetical protein GOP47_0003293 [Adiantum capillus-veneris]|uniref:Uncharacterized protein n=1 Tax=Adiantum capillus-veneris TaxID=13818 RepID=A0A9D4VBP4_ADICA|nr:hypothetical protein GOP47_0003293 [Adiantum capillus-veneris]